MEQLKRIEQGRHSLMSAAEANKVIDALNLLISLQVIPAGTFKIEEGKAVLDLTGLIPVPPSTGIWFWGAVNGKTQWIENTESCTPPP